MAASIDALTSPTLKYLRERWWNDEFAEFLTETLRPRPGNRILDVGCGEGIAEISIGRLHVSQLRLVGIDIMIERVLVARHEAAAHNQRVGYATADAVRLPFRDDAFDSTFCVAVLQHLADVEAAVEELSRVTRRGGLVLAVEPDNLARYFYSETPAGLEAFRASSRFFAAVSSARAEVAAGVGPHLAGLFARHSIEPLDVRLFPVSQTHLGVPSQEVWVQRRDAVARSLGEAPSDSVRDLAREYLDVLSAYAAEAEAAGSGFVEIQNTLLFATVGQKT